MKTFVSGAKSTEQKPRYDLLELCAIRRWAQRMAHGAASHGERNYQNGAGDAEFVQDRVNHMLEHAHKYASGDQSDDHLGAIMANAGMLIWLEEHCQIAQQINGNTHTFTVNERDLAGVLMGPDCGA